MDLYFCPKDRYPAVEMAPCPFCGDLCTQPAETYAEKLMETILNADFDRVGMAIDILTKWMRDPRTVVPLIALLYSSTDLHRRVMAVRGMGWLKEMRAIPDLIALLDDASQPFLLRINAAQGLGGFDRPEARDALMRAANDSDANVSRAARKALEGETKEVQDHQEFDGLK